MMKKKESQEQVIGLTLQLQKFGVGKVQDRNDTDANTILGHYDHLEIRKVTRWLEYSPRMDWENEAKGMTTNLPSSHYPIKLLFPCEDGTNHLSGFYYEDWKDYHTLLEKNPCVTVVLLNLTDAYKAQVEGDLLGAFLYLLKSGCEADLLSEVHCCVLPSLGYSDFCILMAGGSWCPALQLVENLHSLTVPALKEPTRIPVLSTDYMMPVCHPRAGAILEEKFPDEYFEGIELAVRVNLCPGVTAQQLANRLRDVQVYRTSGGTDCLLLAKAGQAQSLMSTLMGSTEQNVVIDMSSTPQLRIKPSQREAGPGLPLMEGNALTQCDLALDSFGRPARSFNDEIRDFKTAVQRYAKQLKKFNRHNRQASALQELTAVIESVCTQPHTGALRDVIKNLMNSFASCLERCAEDMSQPDWDFDEMEGFVSEFSGIVGRFLEDLSRSDCFFMDREKYNHASVSSATSLLIAYNQWLNEFTEVIRKATQENNHSHYSFLVTCGGRDQTQTTNAFYFLKPRVDKNHEDQLYENLPLVTQMSEMSLFDFSGTILRSFHECMHFVGARRRRQRLPYFLKFVTFLLSVRIVRALLNEESCKQTLQTLRQLGGKPELLGTVEEAYRQTLDGLAQDIAELLLGYLSKPEENKWTEPDFLSENVRVWAYKHLMMAFSGHVLVSDPDSPPKLRQNKLAAGIYDKTLKANIEFRQKCADLCHEHGISTVVFDFSAQRLEELRKADERIPHREDEETYHRADAVLSCQVQMILSRLLISLPSDGMPMQANEENMVDYEEWIKNFPYFTLIYHNVADVLQGATDIFSETFADVAACTVLGAGIEDYLLMHVYEQWDLDSALSVDEMSITYRVPAVLSLCFKESLEDEGKRLTPAARDQVKTAITRLVAHGMPGNRLDADSLCGRIDELLQAFAESSVTSRPLMDYLSLCREDYQTETVREGMQKFSDAFQKIRLFAADQRGERLHRSLVEMYNALYNGWRDGDGERKDYL